MTMSSFLYLSLLYSRAYKRRKDKSTIHVDVLEAMDDLTDEQKADASKLFKCDLNRQLFIKTKNPNVRRIWLMKRFAP
jgi:hypothetical protein